MHYAHKPPQALACTPDLVLHRTAQELVLSGFRNAVAQGGEYRLGRLCAHCDEVPLTCNVAQAGSVIDREVSAVDGTRSDLLITDSNGAQLVIEVVHTHDGDEAAADAYSQSGIRVLKIRPVWLHQDDGADTVASEPGLDGLALDAGALAYASLNLSPRLCGRCKDEEAARCREADEEAARRQAQRALHQAERRWEREAATRHREEAKTLVSLTKLKAPPKLQYIIQVGLDHNLKHATRTAYLRSDTKNRINRQAHQLASVGFIQSPTRPTLFTYNANGRLIFADLDSTTVLKAWERNAPALYSFEGPGCQECVLQEVQLQLSSHGILYDRHYEDTQEHYHYESNPPERSLHPPTRESQRREQERQDEERQRRAKERWEEERQQLLAWADESPEDRKKFLAGLYGDASQVARGALGNQVYNSPTFPKAFPPR